MDRSESARIAALTRWSREDPKPNARRGQRGLRQRLAREITDEFPELSAAEVARRVDVAIRLHMTRLAIASAQARRARKAAESEVA